MTGENLIEMAFRIRNRADGPAANLGTTTLDQLAIAPGSLPAHSCREVQSDDKTSLTVKHQVADRFAWTAADIEDNVTRLNTEQIHRQAVRRFIDQGRDVTKYAPNESVLSSSLASRCRIRDQTHAQSGPVQF
jgi:hypothetical protein